MSTNITLQEPVSVAQIQEILRHGCPDLDLGRLGPATIASRSPWVAAGVNIQGKIVSVIPMVRDAKMLLLLLLTCLSGVGLVLYAVLAIPRQQELVKRVRALLTRELAVAR